MAQRTFSRLDYTRRITFYRNSICFLLVYDHHGVCLLHPKARLNNSEDPLVADLFIISMAFVCEHSC